MKRSIFEAEHDAFRDSARAYVDRHIRPHHDRFAEQRQFDRETWLAAGELGFLGLEVPARYGGAEAGDYRFNTVVTEELAKAGVAYPATIGLHYDIVAPYLVDLCTDEQKERWLPPFCTGELLTGIGMTEPSGGSDLAALRTTAVRQGGDWVLNGSKTFITNGSTADLVVVAARTSPEAGSKGITLFGVERSMAGFATGRKLDKIGQHESDTAELFFDDLRVPDANRIGEVDRGFIHMMERLPQERMNSAITNIANAADILQETLVYARERKAFGQPIGHFQHNKFRLAEMVTEVEVAQAFIDQCVVAHTTGELSAVDAAKAKWWSADAQGRVLDGCVQLFGGYGFMNEYRVGRAWRDARITRIWAGTNEIMKEIIGRDLGL